MEIILFLSTVIIRSIINTQTVSWTFIFLKSTQTYVFQPHI